MLFAEVICTLGIMAPQYCLPADDLRVNIVCNKHESDPIASASKSDFGNQTEVVSGIMVVEQPCKAEIPASIEQ